MSAATYSQMSSFGSETFTALTVQGACRFIPSRTPSTSTASRIEYDTFTSVEWLKKIPCNLRSELQGLEWEAEHRIPKQASWEGLLIHGSTALAILK